MLTTLENGVKGGKWFSLIDKVFSKRNLQAAFDRVKSNRGSAGVDRQTIKMYERCLEKNIDMLHDSLKNGTYRPQAVRRAWIPKPGSKDKRPLGIPTVRDRVVQTAMRNVLEPIYEQNFAEHSYGFRPGRGCKDALRRVQTLLDEGYTWVLDADIMSYFDSISHERLLDFIEKKVSDSRITDLMKSYLKQEVMDGADGWTPDGGTPQGAVISPLLSNIYLDPLDHLMADRGYEMVRYADDFVIMCRNESDARKALAMVGKWMTQAGLTLHPDKTLIVDAAQKGGFEFLGYKFERGYRSPRKKSLKKLRDKIRVKTKRTNGHSMETVITDINRTLRGWFEYYKHSHKTTFRPLDGWVRMRLRSILRKRHKGKGRGRGRDHQRWPNAYFAEFGLFSLTAAYEKACQSSRR